MDICGAVSLPPVTPPGDSDTLNPDDKLVNVTVGAAAMNYVGGKRWGTTTLVYSNPTPTRLTLRKVGILPFTSERNFSGLLKQPMGFPTWSLTVSDPKPQRPWLSF